LAVDPHDDGITFHMRPFDYMLRRYILLQHIVNQEQLAGPGVFLPDYIVPDYLTRENLGQIAKYLKLIPTYLERLSIRLGRQLGKLHKAGIVHNYLDPGHNVLLDGSFLDFDGAEENATEKMMHNEVEELLTGRGRSLLRNFINNIRILFHLPGAFIPYIDPNTHDVDEIRNLYASDPLYIDPDTYVKMAEDAYIETLYGK